MVTVTDGDKQRAPLSVHLGFEITVHNVTLQNYKKLNIEQIYLVCVFLDTQDIRYFIPKQYSKVFCVAGGSSLRGKEHFAKTF